MFVQLHVPMLFANLKRRRTDSSESESETPPQGFAAQTSWLDSGPRPAAAGSLSTGLRLSVSTVKFDPRTGRVAPACWEQLGWELATELA